MRPRRVPAEPRRRATSRTTNHQDGDRETDLTGAVLQRHGITVTVLERDDVQHARDQGGTLDMSPFSGEGANRAMLDGAELAAEILTGPDLATAVLRYERTMFPRATLNALGAAEGLDGFFSADGSAHAAERRERMIAEQSRRNALAAAQGT